MLKNEFYNYYDNNITLYDFVNNKLHNCKFTIIVDYLKQFMNEFNLLFNKINNIFITLFIFLMLFYLGLQKKKIFFFILVCVYKKNIHKYYFYV